MSDAELIHLALAILMAGYETTAGQVSMSALVLLTADIDRRQVTADLPQVIDELLRLTPATPTSFPRVALEDVDLGTVVVVVVRTGEAVLVS